MLDSQDFQKRNVTAIGILVQLVLSDQTCQTTCFWTFDSDLIISHDISISAADSRCNSSMKMLTIRLNKTLQHASTKPEQKNKIP